jgi:hypothetical protein
VIGNCTRTDADGIVDISRLFRLLTINVRPTYTLRVLSRIFGLGGGAAPTACAAATIDRAHNYCSAGFLYIIFAPCMAKG